MQVNLVQPRLSGIYTGSTCYLTFSYSRTFFLPRKDQSCVYITLVYLSVSGMISFVASTWRQLVDCLPFSYKWPSSMGFLLYFLVYLS